jgi:hypothetical protein
VTVNGGAGSAAGSGGGAVFKGGATAIRGYSAEYEPGTIERERLVKLSERTKGRGVITATQVFDGSGLVAGKRLVNLAPWLLSAAALLWVLGIALWRVPFGKPAFAVPVAVPTVARAARPAPESSTPPSSTPPSSTPPEPPKPPEPPAPPAPPAPKSDLQELLKAARERRGD